jgi:hypothetical protein
MVAAGSVAEFFSEIRQHSLNDPRINLGSGVIIEINWQLYSHFSISLLPLPQNRAQTASLRY